ncbi:MAG: glycosyltransferase family 4 protein [Anaerolineae bacterium]|nr:glycosyltransferase family 4 protein [Anaerolineae bacterium]
MQPAEYHIGLNAHLLTAQAGYRSAGISGYIANLLRALPAADPALRYTVFAGPQAALPADSRLRVRRSAWRTEHPLARILWEQIAQPLALERDRPDLVHQLAFVAPVLARRPFVVTVYDLSFVHFPERLPPARRRYLRLLTRWSCQRARRVIAISRSTAADLTATFGLSPERIDVAVPGVDEAFHPLPRAEVEAFRARAGLPDRFLLYLGTLEPRKNLPLLLRAYAALPASDRSAAPLVLAGARGWMVDAIDRALDEHDLRGSVRLPGYVPAQDLPLWYNAAEALVYPSLFEGFGLPVIEAMACGTPALVADTSSLPEAVGDMGVCLPPDDAAAWTNALAHILHDTVWRAEAGQRGRERAREFTWARTAAQTVASYRRALGLPVGNG